MKVIDNEINNKSNKYKKSENYNSLSKLDLKILIREIDQSFNTFLCSKKPRFFNLS